MKDILSRHNPKEQALHALKVNQAIGGSRAITYGGTEVIVPALAIHLAMDKFLCMGDEYRKYVMQSVNSSLSESFPSVKNSTASQDKAIECARDISIWFANEVIEGRATFSVQ